jgi:drug/metabolite transporter (DMT)-like permease
MNTLAGIGLYLAATFLFTVMAAFIRYVGERVPLGEVIFARSFFAIIPLTALLAWRGEIIGALRTANPWGHASRALTGVVAMFFNFAGLARIPLAEATAISFATPLFNVVLAALLLGERVRVFRWSTVAFGFIGVLVMLSPHLGQVETTTASALGATLTLIGSFLVALAMTQVRHMSARETTASLVFSFTVISSLIGLATLPWGWTYPEPYDLAALIGMGIAGGMGQIAITESYRHAPASVVAPFAYTAMLWSLAIGFLAFSEVPQGIVLAGAAIVVAAGLVVIWRERKLGLQRALKAAAMPPAAGTAV